MEETRWRGRPVLGALVRAGAYLVPVVCSVLVGALMSRALPTPQGAIGIAGWWLAVLASSGATVMVVERAARRLLPLGALLSLSLAFPDRAPSRFRMAVRAGGTRRLEERIAAARGDGPDATPTDAAAAILELATLLNTHDRRTRGHSERVRVFSDLLGEELQLPEDDRDRLRWAALLHDIGKLSVPASILNKPGKPTDDEWAVLQGHPDEGETFLAPLQGWLGPWTTAATQHHERWDGTGYPNGLAGHDISLAARIVSVADSYEVMTATRAYKRPMSADAARAELARCAGTQFDPVIVRAFLGISLGRLRFAAGPLAWLAQIPFLGEIPRLATAGGAMPSVTLAAQTSMATAAMATAATAATVGVAMPPAETETEPAAAVTVETGVLGEAEQRDAGAAVVVTTTTPAPTTAAAPSPAPAAVPETPAAPDDAPPRSERGAERSQGRGTDEAAAREAERRAAEEQRQREAAEREAQRQADEAARQQAQAERDAQRQADEAAREAQRQADEEARRQAEQRAREQADRDRAGNDGPSGDEDEQADDDEDDDEGDEDDDEGDEDDD